jgi:hypothetical protein
MRPRVAQYSTWATGTFDSLTPYILKGNAAALDRFYDTLMTGTLDEPIGDVRAGGEAVEYPESREWAIFHMRPEARFQRRHAGDRAGCRVFLRVAGRKGASGLSHDLPWAFRHGSRRLTTIP